MLKAYASENYEKLFRQPAEQLTHPFIVPGSESEGLARG